MNDKLKAEESKCWGCLHGVCVQEVEIEHVYHANMKGMSQDEYDIFDGVNLPENDEGELIEHTIEHTRIKTFCFWRPSGAAHAPPLLMAKVSQCNRYLPRY